MPIVNGKNYNGDDFDLVTNPYGFDAGGHQEVISPAIEPNYIELSADTIADGTNSLQTTSASANTFGVGSKSWTMDAIRPFLAGQRVRMINLDDMVELMTGTVTSWTPATLVLIINVTQSIGSGSSSNWISTLDGEVGIDGTFDINSLSAATPVNADELAFYDDTGGTNKKVTFADFYVQMSFKSRMDF